jgi:hypothetical protein
VLTALLLRFLAASAFLQDVTPQWMLPDECNTAVHDAFHETAQDLLHLLAALCFPARPELTFCL